METTRQMPSGPEWHAVRQEAQKKIDKKAAGVADLYWQAERIRAYLPTLRKRREEAAKRLDDLDELIADEMRAVEEIREALR